MMDLESAARAWLGVPWRHLGRSRAGVDCIGLVLLSAAACGLALEDPAPYPREPQGRRLVDAAERHGRRLAEPEPGAVVLFRYGPYAGHAGIAATCPRRGSPTLIHAYAPHRVVCEHAIPADMRAAMVGAWRLHLEGAA